MLGRALRSPGLGLPTVRTPGIAPFLGICFPGPRALAHSLILDQEEETAHPQLMGPFGEEGKKMTASWAPLRNPHLGGDRMKIAQEAGGGGLVSCGERHDY